jgi:hypothetical protein
MMQQTAKKIDLAGHMIELLKEGAIKIFWERSRDLWVEDCKQTIAEWEVLCSE